LPAIRSLDRPHLSRSNIDDTHEGAFWLLKITPNQVAACSGA
jgi:hypothetical protein